MEKPRLTAIRFKEYARVIFSGLAYRATDTELAGLKVSATSVSIKIITAKVSKVRKRGSMRNSGITRIRLQVCTLKLPNLSVSQPPSQEPATEPSPKQPSTKPICVLEKLSSDDMYIPKNGITIEPVRLMSITKANSQAAGDNPL